METIFNINKTNYYFVIIPMNSEIQRSRKFLKIKQCDNRNLHFVPFGYIYDPF